jgi:hypothetical protein
MNLQAKRQALIEWFRDQLRDQTAELEAADESQQELMEEAMEKTLFSLSLLEDGRTVFNGEEIHLNDTKIEMMYRNYIENPH